MSEEKKIVELKEEDLVKVTGGNETDASDAKYKEDSLFHKNDGYWDIYLKITGISSGSQGILYQERMVKVKVSDGSIIKVSGTLWEWQVDGYTPITSVPSNINF